jgi:LuxR family maltose regulon positive regulatory protein
MTLELDVPPTGDGAPSSVPRTLQHFLSRHRLLKTLDDAASERLIVLRAPGGTGKTTLLVDWLRQRQRLADPHRVVWIALDRSAASRAGFWRRMVGALVAAGVATTDGPLGDVLSGYVDLDRVPSLVLDELSQASTPVRVVLDDFHLIDNSSVDDVVWLLENSRFLHILVTTRRRGLLEEPRMVVRLEPTLLTGSQLSFDLAETTALIDLSRGLLTTQDAATIHHVTHGHPLATRVTIATLLSDTSDSSDPLSRSATVTRIATHSAHDLMPAFTDATRRDVALRLALAPSADLALAVQLSGRSDVEHVLREFERDGFGEFSDHNDSVTFSFHSLVGASLEWEAEQTLGQDDLDRLRRMAARHLVAIRNPLGALRLLAKVGDTRAMWPVIAQNFSELITHHQADLKVIIGFVPSHALHSEGTLAIALAIVLGEEESIPSTYLRHLVDTALEQLEPRRNESDPVELFWTLLARFAGLRAARRYREAAQAGEEFLGHVSTLAPADRALVGGAIMAGSIQIVITDVLVGQLDDAISLAHQFAYDPHPGRAQHRLSLLAYIQAMRGEMTEAAQFSRAITQARAANWRATVPATGWHVAETFLRLENNDPEGAIEVISALDSRVSLLEHWPFILWVKGLARLAAGTPEIGLDELAAAVRINRSRSASPFALDLLGALQSDLHLAAGAPKKAHHILDQRSPDATPVVLARSRLHLAAGDHEAAKLGVNALLRGERTTPRQQAEALLLLTAAELRLGLPDEATHYARRAFASMQKLSLRLPLMMVPRTELHGLLSVRLPEFLPLLDGYPDPFRSILAPVALTKREQLVLMELASSGSLETVAQRLFVSANTVKTQLKSIYRKLGVTSREAAVSAGRQRGLLED